MIKKRILNAFSLASKCDQSISSALFLLSLVNLIKTSPLHIFALPGRNDQTMIYHTFAQGSKCDHMRPLPPFARLINMIKESLLNDFTQESK